VVELVERRTRLAGQAPGGPQRYARDRAQRSRLGALADDVAHHDDRARGRVDHVVEVAAGLHVLPRRPVDGRDLAARQHRRRLRAQAGRQRVRDLRAVAQQPRVAERVGDPLGERLGDRLVGVVEAAVRLRRNEGERPEHIVARAQRHDQQRGQAERLEQLAILLVERGRAHPLGVDVVDPHRRARAQYAGHGALVVDMHRMERPQPVRQRHLRRLQVGDGGEVEIATGTGQLDPAPVGERGDRLLRYLLQRGVEVERRAEQPPRLRQQPLAQLRALHGRDVLGQVHREPRTVAVVLQDRALREQPALLAAGAIDPAHEHRRRVALAIPRSQRRNVPLRKRPPVGVVQREALPQLGHRRGDQALDGAGAHQGRRRRVGHHDPAVGVEDGHRILERVHDRLERAQLQPAPLRLGGQELPPSSGSRNGTSSATPATSNSRCTAALPGSTWNAKPSRRDASVVSRISRNPDVSRKRRPERSSVTAPLALCCCSTSRSWRCVAMSSSPCGVTTLPSGPAPTSTVNSISSRSIVKSYQPPSSRSTAAFAARIQRS